MKKRGQLALFLLVGIIILLFLLLFSTAKNKVISDNQPDIHDSQFKHVSNSLRIIMESCIKEIGKQGLNQGYIGLPYYIETHLPSCTGGFRSFPYHISTGKLDAQMSILDDNSSLDLIISYPLTIKAGHSVTRVDNYHVKLQLDVNRTLPVDNGGRLTQDFVLRSPDKRLTLVIDQGSVILGANGNTVTHLSVDVVQASNEDLSDGMVGDIYYDIKPHVNISGNAEISWKYDESELPQFSDESLVFAWIYNQVPIIISSLTNKENNIVSANINQTRPFVLMAGNETMNIKYDMYYTLDEGLKQEALLEGYTIEESLGYAYNSYHQGSLPLFELYNIQSGIHVYTTDKKERQWLIDNTEYTGNGIVGFIEPKKKPGTIPVYRLRPVFGGDVLLTTNISRKEDAVSNLLSILKDSYTTTSGDINDFADEVVEVIDGGNFSRYWNISPKSSDINIVDYQDHVYSGIIGYVYQVNAPGTKKIIRLMNVKATVFWGPWYGIIRKTEIRQMGDNNLGVQPIAFTENMITAAAITNTRDSTDLTIPPSGGVSSDIATTNLQGIVPSVVAIGIDAGFAEHGVSLSGVLGLSASTVSAISALTGPASTICGTIGGILGGPLGSLLGHVFGAMIDSMAPSADEAEAIDAIDDFGSADDGETGIGMADTDISLDNLGDVSDGSTDGTAAVAGMDLGNLGDVSDGSTDGLGGIDLGGLGDVGDSGGLGIGDLGGNAGGED